MKRTILGLMAVLACSNAALAASDLEEVLVTKVKMSGDLMPGSGSPKRVTTVISFQAMSGGCTDEKSFALKVESSDKAANVSLVRVKPDNCEAMPHPIDLKLSTKEIAPYSGVFVLNPVLAERHYTH